MIGDDDFLISLPGGFQMTSKRDHRKTAAEKLNLQATGLIWW
jgi:hypothetical protein